MGILVVALLGLAVGQSFGEDSGPNETLKQLSMVELKVEFGGLWDAESPNVGPPSTTTKKRVTEAVTASLSYLGISIIKKRDSEVLQRAPILKVSSHITPFSTSGGHDGTFSIELAVIEPMRSLRTSTIRWMTTWQRTEVWFVPIYKEGIAFQGPLRKFMAEKFERPWKAHNKPETGS